MEIAVICSRGRADLEKGNGRQEYGGITWLFLTADYKIANGGSNTQVHKGIQIINRI